MTQQEVYDILKKERRWMTSEGIAKILEKERGSITVCLNKLLKQLIISKKGCSEGRTWVGDFKKPFLWKIK